MEQITAQHFQLDARLAALLPILQELRTLREYLNILSKKYELLEPDQGNSVNARVEPPLFWQCIMWVDSAINRITPHLHTRHWPPIWWRLSGLAIDSVARNFHRADADGYFFEADPEHPEQTRFITERDLIMAWVDRIDQMYRAVH